MSRLLFSAWARAGVAVTAVLVAAATMATAGYGTGPVTAGIPDGARFYVKEESGSGAGLEQANRLRAAGKHAEAAGLERMIATPQAVWLVADSPREVREQARRVTERAAAQGRVPVLVAYHIPFRDCSSYSAGGAGTPDRYREWIEAVAAGIGHRAAVVVLEPDSLGMIPWYTSADGSQDGCRPAGADPATAAADRFGLLNHAVDALRALPATSVYLDATHSGWLGVGEAAERLARAGVDRADGFALNVSNYEATDRQLKYGSWVAKCLYYATVIDPDNYSACASQYHPADPGDYATWGRTDEWYATHVDQAPDAPAPEELAHFVIDTSRNGQGPWTPERDYPDAQNWCNPPGRGLGRTPTADTGHPLADAFLWIKIPGESDGSCDRGLGEGAADPEWGRVDPPAGVWFPEQALDLLRHAEPALTPFRDVPAGHDFFAEIAWMADAGISGGWATPAGKEYRPHVAVDRGVMAAFLHRLAGSPEFSPPSTSPFVDVATDAPFYPEIAWMADAGISGGWATPAGKEYRPHAPVDRGVMAAFLHRMAGSPDYTPPATSPFVDVATDAPFYPEIAWMADTGISRGWATPAGRQYRPHAPVDRGVMAAFLHRLAPLL